MHTASPITMQCMEVWGGNQAASNGVVMPGLDAWVASRPYKGDDAGGDIHYVSSCAAGHITRMLVADVSGHGAPVAGIATNLRGLMRRYINFIDQSRLVRALNVEFTSIAEAGGFATALVATYFAPRSELVITSAGHPRPIIYRAAQRRWEPLEFRGTSRGLANIPLGIAEPTQYDQARFRLDRADMVLMFTDSLVEAKLAAGGRLGERGLLEAVSALDADRPEALIDGLFAALQPRLMDGAFDDDATLLLMRPNRLGPRRSITSHVRGVIDVVRGLVQR